MVDRFAPLKEHLAAAAARDEQSVALDFVDVDRLVGGLPGTAYTKKQWWANGPSAQAKAWKAAGWRVNAVGFYQKRVVFSRTN